MKIASLVSYLKNSLRVILGPLLPWIRSARRFPKFLKIKQQAAQLQKAPGIAVCYLTSQFPQRPALRTEIANGGAVKLTFLAENFPHSYPHASLLYTVSSVENVAKTAIVRHAKQAGIKVVLNQNGVSYPAWHGKGWEVLNQEMSIIHQMADLVIYQSEFCKLGARKFLGEIQAPSLVIYNPVDVDLYQPSKRQAQRHAPILLLGGNQYERYRLEVALKVLKHIQALLPGTQLMVTGKLWGENQQISMSQAKQTIQELGLTDKVEFIGTYSQNAAPGIFQRADILIHTKYNDPSPNLITEALASGLPVIYSASGGVPELVGKNAGIGLDVEQSWEKISHPDPQLMAEAVCKVWENRNEFSEAARQRAVENFSLEKFAQLHHELFAHLLE